MKIIVRKPGKLLSIQSLPKSPTAMAIPRVKPTKSHFFFTLGKRRAVTRGEKNLQKNFSSLDVQLISSLPGDKVGNCHYGEKVGACLLAKPKRLPEGGHEHPKGAHRGPAGHHREGEEEEEWVGEHLPDKDLTKAGKPELATDNKAAFVAFLANPILTFVSSCQWPGSNNFFAIFPVLFT